MSLQWLEGIKYFLLDLDGTVYLGDKLIGNMVSTLNKIRNSGRKIIYLTNNSSKSASKYLEKLKRLGIYESGDEVYTSLMAAAEYLVAVMPEKRVFVLGTEDAKRELAKKGVKIAEQGADVALLCYDTEMTYDKIVCFNNLLAGGAEYIATHPDFTCPADGPFVPDAGSFIKLFEASSGRVPSLICGKPYEIMGEALLRKFGGQKRQFVMVGDRLNTDIAFAKNNGFFSILVLSGETDSALYKKSSVKADLALNDLNEIISLL